MTDATIGSTGGLGGCAKVSLPQGVGERQVQDQRHARPLEPLRQGRDMVDGQDHLLYALVDVRPTRAVVDPDHCDRTVVEYYELDLRLAAASADQRQGQQIVVPPNERMHIGEVF